MTNQKNEHIENIRSEEVQEILGYVPHWMIRWGITLVFVIVLMLLFISWMVKYPDVIEGEVVVTTKNIPIRLVNTVAGKLENLNVKNGEEVKKRTILASIKNPISKEDIHIVTEYCDTISSLLKNENYNIPQAPENLSLGSIQSSWNELLKYNSQLIVLKNQKITQQRVSVIKKEIEFRKRLTSISQSKMKLAETEWKRNIESLNTGKELLDKGIISKQKFEQEKKQLDASLGNFQSSKEAYLQNNISINSLKKQLFELEFSNQTEERNLVSNLCSQINTIRSFIKTWKQSQLITSPIAGRISIPKKLIENQFYPSNQELFVLIPKSDSYIGFIKVPVAGAGKVKMNQKVTIDLQDYPSKEFGSLDGKVIKTGEVSEKGFYEVEIELDNGLTTSYNKKITPKPEMQGTAKIITEDLRVIERIFNQFRTIFENK